MDNLLIELTESLRTGFLDHDHPSKKEYLPQFLSNDKINGKKILATIQQELKECEEFWFSVAFVTKSGVMAIVETLLELEAKGVKGKILVSQYQNFTEPEALRLLLKLNNIKLKILVDGEFHAKGYLFKKKDVYDLIIGSSNLTGNALCSNKEWNLKISATSNSNIIKAASEEFKNEFEIAIPVNKEFIDRYEKIYKSQLRFLRKNEEEIEALQNEFIKPNLMQLEALRSLSRLRGQNKSKALIISATGTGKTYLSAFDVKEVAPKKFLFVVHRANIAQAAMKSFRKVLGAEKSMGMYSGEKKEIDADFIFSTIQTISKDNHLTQFKKGHFNYIVFDETHRSGSNTYQKVLNYFNPEFLLGMTATPERTDGFDIFKQFDYNVAYEIRLHRALQENLLSPFHYFGITDISVKGQIIQEDAAFSLLTANERVNRIIEKANFYGCDDGQIRGLVFCRSIDECDELANAFNRKGFKAISLTGKSSEDERSLAIARLESNDENKRLHYIFTVDIFNEGIDIPRVNQVIMLRPTQSAIVFVQQLGRGLRKAEGKKYLTIIDFIGNYSNNYLVPIALYGDTTYNKDTLRKLMATGSSMIPGASTINFDKVSQERIFEAIDKANMQLKRDLVNDYQLLKFRIGRIPTMMDFVEQGSRDPYHYVSYSRSFYNFLAAEEDYYKNRLPSKELKLIELFSTEIGNSKRVEECIILQQLIANSSISVVRIKEIIRETYKITTTDETILSCIDNINFEFVTERKGDKLISVNEKYKLSIITLKNGIIRFEKEFRKLFENQFFLNAFNDIMAYSKAMYDKSFELSKYVGGFVLYRKYSRKDVFRILNWKRNPIAQNVGGYIMSEHKTNCPIFVNYHKGEEISESTKYEDGFINNYEFEWMSKSKRTLKSPEIIEFMNYKKSLRLPLFIKKSNDEGSDFYYMGDITPIPGSFEQTNLTDNEGKKIPVVKIKFLMKQPVEDSIYQYITAIENKI